MSSRGKVLLAITAIGAIVLAVVAIVKKVTNEDTNKLPESEE